MTVQILLKMNSFINFRVIVYFNDKFKYLSLRPPNRFDRSSIHLPSRIPFCNYLGDSFRIKFKNMVLLIIVLSTNFILNKIMYSLTPINQCHTRLPFYVLIYTENLSVMSPLLYCSCLLYWVEGLKTRLNKNTIKNLYIYLFIFYSRSAFRTIYVWGSRETGLPTLTVERGCGNAWAVLPDSPHRLRLSPGWPRSAPPGGETALYNAPPYTTPPDRTGSVSPVSGRLWRSHRPKMYQDDYPTSIRFFILFCDYKRSYKLLLELKLNT